MSKISVERIDPLTPAMNVETTFWRVTGSRVRGVVTAIVGHNDDGPTMHLGLDWTATDERGHNDYRDADPDAYEVQTMHAVAIDPLRVNGVPYFGMRTYNVTDPATPRYSNGWADNMTDAGRPVVDEIARLVAAQLVTPEATHAALLRDLARDLDRARDDLDRATAAYNVAHKRYSDAEMDRP